MNRVEENHYKKIKYMSIVVSSDCVCSSLSYQCRKFDTLSKFISLVSLVLGFAFTRKKIWLVFDPWTYVVYNVMKDYLSEFFIEFEHVDKNLNKW